MSRVENSEEPVKPAITETKEKLGTDDGNIRKSPSDPPKSSKSTPSSRTAIVTDSPTSSKTPVTASQGESSAASARNTTPSPTTTMPNETVSSDEEAQSKKKQPHRPGESSPISDKDQPKTEGAGETQSRPKTEKGKEKRMEDSGRSDSDSSREARYQPVDLIRIMVPVTLCILFVVLMTILTTKPGVKPRRPWMALTPFNTEGADAKTEVLESMANVGIMIGVIVGVTFLVLILYLCYCYKCLIVLLAIPVVIVNLVFTWTYLAKVCKAMNIPLDHITAALFTINFGTIGIVSILGRTPKRLQQFYLLYLCGVMAILYVQFMPDFTVWLFLAALAVWDLIAVLTPCGPLRILVETVQEREHDFVPAMVYTTGIFFMVEKDSEGDEKAKAEREKQQSISKSSQTAKSDTPSKTSKADPNKRTKPKEKQRLRLGLGDFVFYSLLTGKATEACLVKTEYLDWTIILVCFIAVIMGLLATVVLLVLCNKALPALPISIALGLIFYFSSTHIIAPFCAVMSIRQIFI